MSRLDTTAGSLLTALRLAAPFIQRRSTIPILSCVAFDGRTLRATDLNMEIAIDFPCKARGFKVAVPFSKLRGLCAGLPSDTEISLKDDGADGVTLRFPGGAYRLASMPYSDFPRLDVNEDAAAGKWNVKDSQIADAFRTVAPAISTEETRYYLCGLSLVRLPAECAPHGQEGVCAVATDGHRLIAAPLPGVECEGNPIIPRDAVGAILKIGNPERFELFENRIRVNWPGVSMVSKLIDGAFPDVPRVIPRNTDTSITLDRRRALATVRRMAAISTNRSKDIAIRQAADGVTFSHKDDDTGAGIEAVSETGGEPFQIGFNGGYLVDLLTLCPSMDEITLALTDPAAPARVDLANAVAVLMPLRVTLDFSALPPIDDAEDAERVAA